LLARFFTPLNQSCKPSLEGDDPVIVGAYFIVITISSNCYSNLLSTVKNACDSESARCKKKIPYLNFALHAPYFKRTVPDERTVP